MNRQFLLLLCTLCILSVGCTTTQNDPTKFEDAPLYGMIYDYQNQAVKAVRIYENDELLGESDINGRFYLPKVEKGLHYYTFVKDEYETITLTVEFQNRTEAVYLKMHSAFDYLSMANQHITQQSYAEAADSIQAGLEISPDNIGLLYLDAIVEFKVNLFDDCLASIEELLDTYGRREAAIYHLLFSLANVSQEYSNAALSLMEQYPPRVQDIEVLQELTTRKGEL